MLKTDLDLERVIKLLDSVPFFNKFTFEEKQALAELNHHILKFLDGEYIIRQGDIEFSIYILLKGKVIVTKDENPETDITTLTSGQIFGELSFLFERSRSTNIIACGEAVALQFNAELFEELPASIREKLKDEFLKILIQRLDDMNASVLKLKAEIEDAYQAGEKVSENMASVTEFMNQIRQSHQEVNNTLKRLIR